ncbi:polysaccharide biosynthesis/export family protein, partial [Loktanella salsilacus]
AGELGSDTIRAGDTLGLTIFENVDDGLLVPQGQNASVLEEVQVDGQGYIFVPYAGRILAAGNTPEAIRRIITGKLADQTPDPQVQVRRLAGDGATVSVSGAVNGQGVYPIERPTRSLIPMLAAAGGVAIEPDIARVTVARGDQKAEVFYNDLFNNPRNDVALRDGDAIIVKSDSRTFTVLGATGSQDRVTFESQKITAIEALAQVGGLSSTQADPTGVFVFRNEPEEITEQLVGQDVTGVQRVVYVLDLTRPNGMFMARDFAIRDGDTVYVTEAPFVQFNKAIAAATGSLSAVESVSSTTGL